MIELEISFDPRLDLALMIDLNELRAWSKENGIEVIVKQSQTRDLGTFVTLGVIWVFKKEIAGVVDPIYAEGRKRIIEFAKNYINNIKGV